MPGIFLIDGNEQEIVVHVSMTGHNPTSFPLKPNIARY